MEWYPRQHRDPELGGELVRGTPHERAADHVLDHAEQRRLPVVGGTKCAAHRVARLGCRDGHGEHGGARGEQLGQLLEALHAGREIHEQLVESAPEIGRAHLWTPVTVKSRMPASAFKKTKVCAIPLSDM